MVAEALKHLIQGIVENPDDVEVDLIEDDDARVVEVRVHSDDLGIVIGRRGRTVRALRQVASSIGGRDLRVEIIDDEEDSDDAADDASVADAESVSA